MQIKLRSCAGLPVRLRERRVWPTCVMREWSKRNKHISLSLKETMIAQAHLNVPKSHLVSETELDFIYKENVNEIHRDSADRTD